MLSKQSVYPSNKDQNKNIEVKTPSENCSAMQNEHLWNKLSAYIQALHISLYSSSNFHIAPSQFPSDHGQLAILSTRVITPSFSVSPK